MAPPAKARGGARPIAPGSAEASQGRPKPAPERPPRGRSGGGPSAPAPSGLRSQKATAGHGLPKPPQGHGGFKSKRAPRPPRQEGKTPRYATGESAKPKLLASALEVAEQRGYESLRVSDITEPVGVTRQAFYAHFRDKRHCLAEAIDPGLGVVERMARGALEDGPRPVSGTSDDRSTRWAERVIYAVDEAIAERFGSPEGTRERLIEGMIGLLREGGGYEATRIGALVRTSHVPQVDFYRQFSGKRECFAVAYERLLDQLLAECPAEHTRHELPTSLRSLGEALASDPDRLRILVVEAAHLPAADEGGVAGARKGALAAAVSELLGEGGVSTGHMAAAAVVEVIRSAVLGERVEDLAGELAGVGGGLIVDRRLAAGTLSNAA